MYNPKEIIFQQRKPTVLEKYIMWGLIAVIALAPLPFGSNRPFFWSVLSLFSGLLLLVWTSGFMLGSIYQRVSLARIKCAVYPFVLVIIWACVQTFAPISNLAHPMWMIAQESLNMDVTKTISIDSYKSVDNLMRIIAYSSLFWLSLQVGRSSDNAKTILKSFLFISVFYALFGLITEFSIPEKILFSEKTSYVNYVTSSFLNPNNYATYAGIGALTVFLFFLQKIFYKANEDNEKNLKTLLIRRTIDKAAPYSAFLLAIIVALILTHSNEAIASTLFGCSIAFLLFFSAKPMQQLKKKFKIAIYLTFFFALIAAFFSGSIVINNFNKKEQATDFRAEIYQNTRSAINNFSYLGAGLGNFEQAYNMHRDKDYINKDSARIDHAHNTYLELILELGTLTFTVFMVPFLWLNYRFFKSALSRKRDFIFPILGISINVLVGLNSIFYFSIEIPAIAATYSILMGVCCAQSWSTRQSVSDKSQFKLLSYVFAINICFSLFLLYSGTKNSIESFKNTNSLLSINEENNLNKTELEKTINNKENAIKINTTNANNYNELAESQINLANYYDYGSFERNSLLNSATDNFKLSLTNSPSNGWTWLKLAHAEIIKSGDYEKAAEYLYNSALTNPHGSKIIFTRLKISMILWDYFSYKQQETIIQQIRLAASADKEKTEKILASRGLFLE